MTVAAARDRRTRPVGHVPALAVVGSVDTVALRAAGWQLLGALGVEPYDDPLDAERWTEPVELRDEPRLDAVAVQGADPSVAALLPQLPGDGLRVMLDGPAPLDMPLLQQTLAHDPDGEVSVVFARRWEPWLRTVAAAAPLAGPLVQGTVRGWPRGVAQAAALVDLIAGWCGEVVAAIAAPAPLPAPALPGGDRVSWALLTAGGATVLVSHEGEPAVHLSSAGARLLASPLVCRWDGGDRLPLLPLPAWLPAVPAGTTAGAVACAAAVAREVAGPGIADGPGSLADLLTAARVLDGLRRSARVEAPVPLD